MKTEIAQISPEKSIISGSHNSDSTQMQLQKFDPNSVIQVSNNEFIDSVFLKPEGEVWVTSFKENPSDDTMSQERKKILWKGRPLNGDLNPDHNNYYCIATSNGNINPAT